jgi:DNA-binding protein YbaB
VTKSVTENANAINLGVSAGGSGAVPSTDADTVEAYEKSIQAIRTRLAELDTDWRRRAAALRPINDDVQAVLDSDGFIEDLYIDPTALTRYTHIELEDLITEVLRDSSERLREVILETSEQHTGPESPLGELLK